MDLDTYVSTVLNTSEPEWEMISGQLFGLADHDSLMVLKTNLNISIATGLPHLDNFVEPWVQKFPNKLASSNWVDMLWNGSPVRRELSVLVDSARCGLPLPMPGTMDVPQRKVQFFQLLDNLSGRHEFSDYFRRAGMKSEPAIPWP